MAISVVCPGCKKRFSVSEKFAGKQGPCPKCKTVIRIPETTQEEVKIHAPENFGPKDSTGRQVLMPIFREETKLGPVAIVAIVGGVLLVAIIALVLRFQFHGENVPPALLALGALALGPPLVLGGYSFLRDDELQPHRGASLWIRVAVCSLLYAGLWAAYAIAKNLLGMDTVEVYQMAFIIPLMIGVGGVIGLGSLDLDFLNGAMHYGLYLGVTVLLRLIVQLPPF
jgi:hypothetical protein